MLRARSAPVIGSFVARWLDLPEGRGARAARMLALVFFLSAGLSLMKAAQTGIFLASYPRTMIPWAFAVSSVTLAGLSALSVSAAGRLGIARLGAVALVLSAIALVALRLLLFVHGGIVPFVIYVVVEAASGVLIIQVWAVATAATDARTARRLLPVAGIGGGLAWTISGFAVTPLVAAIGAEGLLLSGAVVLGIALALVVAIERHDLDVHERRGAGRRAGSVRDALRFVGRVPLLRMMATLSILALVVEEVMDFHVMSTARETLGDAAAISAFFGRYYAVTSLLGVLLLAGPAARILGRLGAVRSLVATPFLTAIVALAACLLPGLTAAVLLRGTGRVLKQTLWSNAQEQMQTPVAHGRRAQARAATRGVLAPAGYAVAALLLAAIPAHVDERWLALVVLVLSALMVVVIQTRAKRHYIAALERAVDERRLFLGAGRARAVQRTSLDAWTDVSRELSSTEPRRAALAADVIAAAPTEIAEPALARALAHADVTVRRAVAGALARHDAGGASLAIAAALGTEPDAETRAALAEALRRSLGASPDARTHEVVRRILDGASAETEPRARALLTVADIASRFSGAELGSQLLPLLTAEDHDARSAALAELTPEAAGASGMATVLRTLLATGSAEARLEVAETIVGLGLMPLLPDVVLLLRDATVGRRVARLLVELGDDAFDGARGTATNTLASLNAMARKIADSPGARSDALVRRLLTHRDRAIRHPAVTALADAVRAERRAPLPDALARSLVDDELRRTYRLVSILAGIARDDGVPDWDVEAPFRFLAGEVELAIEASRGEVMTLLLLSGSHGRVVSAVEASRRTPSRERDAQVAELLEVALPFELASRIVPLYERLSLRERVAAAERVQLLDQNAMAHPLDAIVGLGDRHLRGVAALTYGERHAKRFPELAKEDVPLMPRFERIRFLRSVPLFSAVSGDELFGVAEVVREESFPAKGAIFHEDDPGEDLFLVVAGKVAIEQRGQRLALLGEGEVFGDLSVLDHQPRSADAIALEPTTVLRLRGPDLRELVAARPEIAQAILRVLVTRLRETNRRVPGAR